MTVTPLTLAARSVITQTETMLKVHVEYDIAGTTYTNLLLSWPMTGKGRHQTFALLDYIEECGSQLTSQEQLDHLLEMADTLIGNRK